MNDISMTPTFLNSCFSHQITPDDRETIPAYIIENKHNAIQYCDLPGYVLSTLQWRDLQILFQEQKLTKEITLLDLMRPTPTPPDPGNGKLIQLKLAEKLMKRGASIATIYKVLKTIFPDYFDLLKLAYMKPNLPGIANLTHVRLFFEAKIDLSTHSVADSFIGMCGRILRQGDLMGGYPTQWSALKIKWIQNESIFIDLAPLIERINYETWRYISPKFIFFGNDFIHISTIDADGENTNAAANSLRRLHFFNQSLSCIVVQGDLKFVLPYISLTRWLGFVLDCSIAMDHPMEALTLPCENIVDYDRPSTPKMNNFLKPLLKYGNTLFSVHNSIAKYNMTERIHSDLYKTRALLAIEELKYQSENFFEMETIVTASLFRNKKNEGSKNPGIIGPYFHNLGHLICRGESRFGLIDSALTQTPTASGFENHAFLNERTFGKVAVIHEIISGKLKNEVSYLPLSRLNSIDPTLQKGTRYQYMNSAHIECCEKKIEENESKKTSLLDFSCLGITLPPTIRWNATMVFSCMQEFGGGKGNHHWPTELSLGTLLRGYDGTMDGAVMNMGNFCKIEHAMHTTPNAHRCNRLSARCTAYTRGQATNSGKLVSKHGDRRQREFMPKTGIACAPVAAEFSPDWR